MLRFRFHRRFWAILVVLFLASQACLGGAAPAVEEEQSPETATVSAPTAALPPSVTATQPEPAATAAQTEVPQAAEAVFEAFLWAAGASADSSAGELRAGLGCGPDQALGAPDTLACGDFVTAWSPAPETVEAVLTLTFSSPILPETVHAVQSCQPGQIARVDLVTLGGDVITIYDADQEAYPPPMDCPVTNVFRAMDVDQLVDQVVLAVRRPAADPWTQIDAVGVQGRVVDAAAIPAPVETPSAEVQEELLGAVYYTNKNQITDLAWAGDQLWAASAGGVAAWDLTSQTAETYTYAEGLPANQIRAIAACPWEGGKVYAGAANGQVAVRWLEGAPYFEPLDHPGADQLGPVTALGCDPIRGQLWVGYLGHLSRYDPASQTWTEWSEADGMPGDVVRDIQMNGMDIWAATAFGVARVGEGDLLQSFTPQNSEIPSGFIHGIAGDEAGVLWMASSDGLISYEMGAWTLWESEAIGGGVLVDTLMGLSMNTAGELWLADIFGTVCQFSVVTRTCQQVVTIDDETFSLTAFQAGLGGRLALGSLVDGLAVWAGGDWIPLRVDEAPLSNAYHAVAYGPDGALWLAGVDGLQRFPANQPRGPWETVPLSGDARAHSLLVVSDGLWIGHTGGARFLPWLAGEAPLDLPLGEPDEAIANTVTAMARDADGRVFFGTMSGLSIWDGQSFAYFDLLSEAERQGGVYPPRVNALFAEGEVVWVGAANGLYKFEGGELRASWTESLAADFSRSVGAILPSPDGCGLLVGLGQEGVCFDGVQFEPLLSLPSEIRGLFAIPNNLWLATSSAGLYHAPVDSSGVVWSLAGPSYGFAERFGYQAFAMSDPYTLWFAGASGGLLRMGAMWSQ